MTVNHEISKSLLGLIDDLWVYAAPLLLAYFMKDFLANLVSYLRIRWSVMDYCSMGGIVFIDGYWQTIMKISINVIAFERKDNDSGKRIITTMSSRDYWKMKHVFEGKIK